MTIKINNILLNRKDTTTAKIYRNQKKILQIVKIRYEILKNKLFFGDYR